MPNVIAIVLLAFMFFGMAVESLWNNLVEIFKPPTETVTPTEPIISPESKDGIVDCKSNAIRLSHGGGNYIGGGSETFALTYSKVQTFEEYKNLNSNEVGTYNESFFEKNMLLVIPITSSSGAFRYEVRNVERQGKILNVDLERTNDDGFYTTDMVYWNIVIEIPADRIDGCEVFSVTLTK